MTDDELTSIRERVARDAKGEMFGERQVADCIIDREALLSEVDWLKAALLQAHKENAQLSIDLEAEYDKRYFAGRKRNDWGDAAE